MSFRQYESSMLLESGTEGSVPATKSLPLMPPAFDDPTLELLEKLHRQVSNPGERNLLLLI